MLYMIGLLILKKMYIAVLYINKLVSIVKTYCTAKYSTQVTQVQFRDK